VHLVVEVAQHLIVVDPLAPPPLDVVDEQREHVGHDRRPRGREVRRVELHDVVAVLRRRLHGS
jgi:hypothetical protein